MLYLRSTQPPCMPWGRELFSRALPHWWHSLLEMILSCALGGEEALGRELRSLRMSKDHYPKYLLTLDNDLAGDYDGIRRVNARD